MCVCHFSPIVTGSITDRSCFVDSFEIFHTGAVVRPEPTVCIQTLFSFFSVCKTMEISPGNNPFLCMDLTYITFLLQELGFPKSQGFKVKFKEDFWGEWAGGCQGRSHPARSLVLVLPSCYNTWWVQQHSPHSAGNCHNLQHCISTCMLQILPKNVI